MKKLKLGIIGAGWIAEKMAITIRSMEEVEAYAIASRRLTDAQEFAVKYNFAKAYGSYEKLMQDAAVDLVYIATPHSHHHEHARMALLHDKPVLCEKAFTATAPQAEALIELAQERNLFITEAIWTRYMPFSATIKEIMESGVIGKPVCLSANLAYPVGYKERMQRPELAGGALLDLGVYAINFASMLFGTEIKEITTSCIKTETGVDAHNTITLRFRDDKVAMLYSNMYAMSDRQGIISGEKGYILVENINNPQSATVVTTDYKVVAHYQAPPQITGYEYQVYVSIEALRNGWIESPYMPHAETIRIMQLMDDLRKEWGGILSF
ncbi:MAG: Gfo/Idh/MocA family oxidoreductase [Bacteroides sp.]|nr:Gfo/Idh/MocA family oxidoreductase [Bacteroides sp.]